MAYQSEIEKLEQRFREKPEQWFAALADAYRKADQVEKALDVVRAGLEKRPNYTSGHIVLGRCLLDQANDPEAAHAFERVLELDAENIIALKSLSEIADRQGDQPGSKRWLERLLEVDPMNDEARLALESLEAEGVVSAEPVGGPPAVAEPEPEIEVVLPQEQPREAVAEVEPEVVAEPEPAPAPVSEVQTEPTEAISDDVIDEEVLQLETPELAAKISDEFPVPDFDTAVIEPSPLIEPTVDEEEVEELELERSWDFESDVPTVQMEPFGLERVEEPDLEFAGESFEEVVQESAAEDAESQHVEAEEPVWGQASQETIDVSAEQVEDVASDVAPESLEVTSFDEELAWDAGERLSREITDEDLREAERAHEESLEETAHYIPGLEYAEVPDIASGPTAHSDEEVVAEQTAIPEEEADVEGGTAPHEEPRPLAEIPGEAWTAPEFEVTDDEPVPEQEDVLEVEAASETDAVDVPVWGIDERSSEQGAVEVEEEAVAPTDAQPLPSGFEAGLVDEVDVGITAEEPEELFAESDAVADRSQRATAGLPLIVPDEEQELAADDEREPEPEPEPVLTETMAEVYARQGLFGEARHIYEQLLAARPGDPELETRIAELDRRATARRRDEREELAERFAAASTGGGSVRAMLAEVSATRLGLDSSPGAAPQPFEHEVGASESGRDAALDFAFAGADDEPLAAPSAPADDDLSLATVFGEEPTASPPAPEEDSASGRKGQESSYDEFFGGGEAPPPDAEPSSDTPSSEGDGDEGFQDWLESLKT